MKFIQTFALAAMLILAGNSYAYGDVEVTPVPNSPQVSLNGTEIVRDDQPSGTAPINNQQPNDDVRPPIISCRVDEATGIYGCRDDAPGEPADPRPEPTDGDILRATRTIGLPSLRVQVQPGETTLVNVPTVLYAEPRPFQRSVTLLGHQVDLAAEPVSYRWWHGDGTDQETSGPGKPYPAMDVTHRYVRPANSLRPRVDVTYQVRYRTDGRQWRTIGQTLTASGPVAELDVAEAAPVLTKR